MNEKPGKLERILRWLPPLCAVTVASAAAVFVFVNWRREPRPAVAGVTTESGHTQRVMAKAGVGREGRYSASGMVVTPIKAYFRTKQRIELEIRIPQAMNLYKAEHGHYPRTTDEFMREIIEFNQIQLPELPEGHRYVYDAEIGLQVERPE